ncbi:hypothetical protein B0H14DRAFT_2329133, partial [Mycena olivaceomarginata]
WTSPVYSFFKDNVETLADAHDGRKYQVFKCNTPGGCKSKSGMKVNGDPHSDRSSTSNLKKHAKQCWGSTVVDACIKGVAADASRDGSIFMAFARSGQHPVNVSHCTHTPNLNSGVACIVCWITEANRPLNIVADRQLQDLLIAGRPELTVPSRSTAARDLKAVYERSAHRIKKLLTEYDGRLSFATDAWTSPNHRAFVAWMVHLQHWGEPLVFLLDMFEVPEVGLHLIFFYCFSPACSLILVKCLRVSLTTCLDALGLSTRCNFSSSSLFQLLIFGVDSCMDGRQCHLQ